MLWEEFSEFPTENITVEAFRSIDEAGKATYSRAQTVPAVMQGSVRRYIQMNGQQIALRGVAYIGPDVLVTTKDRVTLADGTVPQLLRVDQQSWGPILDHQVLSFA